MFEVQGLHEALHDFGAAGVLAGVLAELAGVVVEGPGLGNLGGYELDDDVHGADTVEVIGEVCAYAEGRLAVVRGVTLDLKGVVHVQSIAEYHLFGARIDAEGAVLVHYAHELFAVVPAVHSQPLEQVGKVLRKVQAEDVPAETVVEEGAEGTPESVAPAKKRI